ncbi:SPOR domain-containing protein [Bartonella sp. B35(2025)]
MREIMSDNDRKNLHKIKQDHGHYDSAEKFEQIFNSNKHSKNQSTQSALQPDQSIPHPSETPFHGDDFDLSFLEAELENNLADGLQYEQRDSYSPNGEQVSMDVTTTTAFNHLEQNSFTHFPSTDLDEEQILDALSPLPIQKNQSPQSKTTPTHIDPLFETDDFDAQLDVSNIKQNYYNDHQSSSNTPINHPYTIPVDQREWDKEYHSNASNSFKDRNTVFSSSDIASKKNSIINDESTEDFSSVLDTAQADKLFALKDFPQENYTNDYTQFYKEKVLEQEASITKIPEYSNAQTQYIDNTENISNQINERWAPYNQNNLNDTQSSSKIFKTTQTDNFFSHNYTHKDTSPPPNINTDKFAEEIVEKTEEIIVPEVPYGTPEYGVSSDNLKEEFSDVFNIGNIPVEDFSQQQQNEIFNEIFHQTVQNSKEDPYVNTPEQNTNYSSPFSKNSLHKSVDRIPANTSIPSISKTSLIIGKVFTRSVVPIVLIVIGFTSYSYFFTSSKKNENPLIIRADDTPFKFKQETTRTENDAAHNLDIYKQATGQNETQEDTQQFLINNSESLEDLTELNEQLSENISSSSFNESDVEDAITEAANHTIPTREIQTVIVKQDGTAILTPMYNIDKDKKLTDDIEKNDKITVNQFQEEPSISSKFSDADNSDINNNAIEHNLLVDIDKIIEKNASAPDINIEKKIKNSFIPIPSQTKFSSETQKHVASHSSQSTRETIQNSESYYVQLASQPTSELAKDSLKNIKSRFKFLIGTRPLNIQPALIPGKGTYYRVRVQTKNRNEAIRLCEEIKNFGGSCFITR